MLFFILFLCLSFISTLTYSVHALVISDGYSSERNFEKPTLLELRILLTFSLKEIEKNSK